MTTTDLKPGDIVQHPERGPGLVGGGKQILYLARDGFVYAAFDPDGWERVETCTTEAVRILEDYQQIASKSAGVVVRDAVVMMTPAVYEAHHGRETVRPGHVQVRIDDLELGPSVYETEGEFVSSVMRDFPEYSEGDLRLIYRALVAQRAESTPPADEKPTNATVELPCPDCGEAITRTAQVWTGSQRDRTLTWATLGWHTCPPAQPDEPTEFGARVTVTLPDGTREKWCRLGKHHPAPWLGETYEVPGEEWRLLCGRGTVTIGWDE